MSAIEFNKKLYKDILGKDKKKAQAKLDEDFKNYPPNNKVDMQYYIDHLGEKETNIASHDLDLIVNDAIAKFKEDPSVENKKAVTSAKIKLGLAKKKKK